MDEYLGILQAGASLVAHDGLPRVFAKPAAAAAAAADEEEVEASSLPLRSKTMRNRVQEAAAAAFGNAIRKLEEDRRRHAERVLEEAKHHAQAEQNGDTLPAYSRMIDYSSSYAGRLEKIAAQMHTRYQRKLIIPRAEDSYAEPAYQMRGFGGDEVLRALRTVFSRFPDHPTAFQWTLFDAMCNVAKAIIYGQTWFSDPNWVLERNGWVDGNGAMLFVLFTDPLPR